MNTNHLYYFIVAADMGSLHKAADKLFVSHQALSISIRNLEKELGTQLFNRSKTGISLTKNGKKVYYMSKRIINDINKTKRMLHIDNAKKDTFTISSLIGMNPLFLESVQQFKTEHQDLILHVTKATSSNAFEDLKNYKVDLIYCSLSTDVVKNLPDNIILLNEFEEKLHALVPLNHSLTNQKDIYMQDILAYPLILYEPNNENADIDEFPFTNLSKEQQENLNIALISDSRQIHLQATASGIGISFISSSLIKSSKIMQELNDIGLVALPIKDNLLKPIYCMTNNLAYTHKGELIQQFNKIFIQTMNFKEKQNS